MEASTTHTKASVLQKAVDSLKANGLSKIGSVVETKMPELLPGLLDTAEEFSEDLGGASFYSDSEASELVQSVKGGKMNNSNSRNSTSDIMDSISIQIYPESVSGLGISIQSNDAQLCEETISADVETVTLSGMETVESEMSAKSVAQSPNAIDFRAPPAADSGFSIAASTKHCGKGKELWAKGKCELALSEFRKALLGLESLLGMDHSLVSRLYHWIGKIYLQLLDDNDNNRKNGIQQKDSGALRRAWADAAVESLSWCLKIRFTSRIAPVDDANAGNSKDGTSDSVSDEDLAVDAEIEESLGKAWKFQDDEWFASPLQQLKRNSSSRTGRKKGLDDLRDSIKIERKADLALFRMEKNQLSSAVDVYASLANQYNKAIAAYSDDGGFYAITKMAFWYHKLGRLKAKMDVAGDSEDEISIDIRSKNSMPMDKTEHATHPNLRKNSGGKSKEYMEQSAFWYRMALEVFCTGIGRFDKTNELHNRDDSIDFSAHPIYRQLISRLREVLSDHHRSDQGGKYLKLLGVRESVLYHSGAKEKMRQHRRLIRCKSDSLSRLKAIREALRKAQDGFKTSSNIEEAAWGAGHQIVIRMQHDLHRANRLGDAIDLEIKEFPEKQAQRQQQEEEEEKEVERQEEEEKQSKLEQKKVQLQEEQPQEKTIEEEKLHRKEEELQEEQLQQLQQKNEELEQQLRQQKKELENQLHQQKKQLEQQQEQLQQFQRKKKQHSPSGSKSSIDRPSTNGIETLRRLEDEIKLLEEKNAERDRLRAALEAKDGEIEEARADAARSKEEAIQWKLACENSRSRQEVLHSRIRQLESKVDQSEQKHGQLEFTRKKEGADLIQSATEKEVERLYWKQKFELAQTEWTECQSRLEDELRKSRKEVGRKEAELMEWRGKYEGLDGEWKTRHGQIESLREENERLQREVTTGLAERKQLLHSKKLNDLEFVQSKEQQVLEAMSEVAKSESEVLVWKRKYEVAEKEWLAIHNKSDVQAREAIADATRLTAELNRWKRKFEIAQREWVECQTRIEAHAQGAIATAKRYETSHTELKEKFRLAQEGLRSLIDQNKLLRKKIADSQSKQDQLEFSLKKQTIDFAKYQDTLNRKTAEAQVWKDQCQASQQAQKQFSHEIQLSRVADGNLQDRFVDLRQQNTDLKERNKELQTEQERNKLELEAKKVELASVREAALRRIRQLKNDQKGKNGHSRERKSGKDNSDINTISTKPEKKNGVLIEYNSNVDLSNPSSLAAKLGRTQRALEYVQRDHKESLEEVKTLTKAKKEMESNITDAQEIISLLKTANNERIEHCSKLERENEQIKRQLEESRDSRQTTTQIEPNEELQKELKEAIESRDALADQVKTLESRLGDSGSNKKAEELKETISTLKSDLQKAIADKRSLANKVEAMELRLDESDSDSGSGSEKNEGVKEIISSLKADLQKEIEEKKALAGKVKSLESRLDNSDAESRSDGNDEELKETIILLKSDLQKSNDDKNALASKVKELELLSHKWDSESESEPLNDDQELNKIISSLKSDLQKSEARNEELLSEIKKQKLRSLSPSKTLITGHSRYRSRRLDNSCHNLSETINPLADRCEELERELVISNHQIAELKEEVKEFSERGDSFAVKPKYHQLQVLQKLEQELEESSQLREDLSSQLETYKERIAVAEEKEKKLQRELDISNKQIETLQDQTRNEKNAIEGNQEDHQLTLVQDLEQQLKESTETRDTLSLQLKDSLKQTEEKQKEYKWLQNEYSTLENKLEKSTMIQEDMSSELNSLKKRLERAEEKENEIDVLEDKFSDLKQKLEESSSENKKLRSQIANLSSTGGSDDEQRKYLVDQISTLEKQLSDSTNEIKVLTVEIAKLEKTTKNLGNVEEEKEELMEKYNELEKQYESTRQQAEQNSKSLSKMLEVESKEQERILKECAKLKDDLQESSKRNTELELRIEENSKSLSNIVEEENKEQERIRKECEKLKEDLQESSEQNIELESRMEEMRVRNLASLSDRSVTSCKQCLALGDELRSTIDQNDKHMEATQKFQDDHEKLLDRCNYLERELNETIEQNEMLESKLIAQENNPRDETLDNDDKYQELNIRCIELEEELRDSNDINRKKDAQLDAMRRTVADLEAYADETAADLEQAMALKADASGRGGEVMLLLERCNKLQLELKESKKEIERLSSAERKYKEEKNQMKEEKHESLGTLTENKIEDTGAGAGSEQAVQELKEKLSSVTAANEQVVQSLNEKLKSMVDDNEQAVEELNEKLNKITSAKEELETQLKKATEESEHQKRLKGHVEKDRDYLDKMYNESKTDMEKIKSDLDATKELLKKSNEQKEELERQLQIEKHVSHSLKTSKEEDNSEDNELEELYRQARDELSEVESMLFETEEELEELKAKYEKLQKSSSKQVASGNSEDTESGEINHNLQDLSREELISENKKALRKLQETQTKLVDLQETNMILQAQLKSSLTFKEKSKANNNNRGFFGFGGGNNNNNNNNDTNAENKQNDGNNNTNNKANDSDNTNKTAKSNNNTGGGGFWSLGGGDTNKSADSDGEKSDASDGSGGNRFWGRRNRAKGGTSN